MLDVGPMVTENLPASSIDTHTDNDIGTTEDKRCRDSRLSECRSVGVSEARRLGEGPFLNGDSKIDQVGLGDGGGWVDGDDRSLEALRTHRCVVTIL